MENTVEKTLVELLLKNNMTISFAESCTGGMLASTLINVSGSSNVINESYVTYSEEAKMRILGVSKETLNKYVGHFIETPIEEGNVALAGHNRGYDVNYFSRLKELREGDEIIYIHNEINRIYEVTKNKIIKDTDIDVLENTEENILTLITCVENEPNYRRCVQAEEKDLNYNY